MSSNTIHTLLIQIPVFLLAVVIHEVAHAWMAYKFGDPTAKLAGRISLNPIVHLDPIGSVVFPLIGAFLGGYMFGWARPVPIDVRYFKNMRQGLFWVSFAGPLSNILGMLICAFLTAFWINFIPTDFSLYAPLRDMFTIGIYVNVLLAAFNLIPFPPLDGSKMISAFLNYNNMVKFESYGRYSLPFLIILMVSGVLSYILYPAFRFAGFVLLFFDWIFQGLLST